MRTSVVELIGMLDSKALGKWSIFARASPVILGGFSGAQTCMFTRVLPSIAMDGSVAIRLKGQAR